MRDDYDIRKEMDKEERKKHHESMQEKPFYGRVSKPIPTFNTVEEAYGEEGLTFKPKKPLRKAEPQVDHDKPFRPSNPPKKGLVDKSIAPFPDYLDDVFKAKDPNFGKVKKIKKGEEEDDHPSWKHTYNSKAVPCRPITTHFKNLRSEFPSMLRRF